jgi:hypothetical protein
VEGQPYLRNHHPPYPATGHNTANTTSQPVMPTISGRGAFLYSDFQLFAVLFQPVQEKNSATEEKNRAPVGRFSFLKEFGFKEKQYF